MLCQNCFRERAKINIIQIINKDHKELNLCESCVEKLGFNKSISNLPKVFTALVGDILKFKQKESNLSVRHAESGCCPVCGYSWQEFERIGLLGCDNCYLTFHEQIKEVLQRIHGTARHKGKRLRVKSEIDLTKNLVYLEKTLREAIEKEEYEKAAEFRDKIRSLKHES